MEISLPMVTARDFPMRLSRVFQCPSHFVHYDLGWWRFPVHRVYTTHQVFVNIELTCIYWLRGFSPHFPLLLSRSMLQVRGRTTPPLFRNRELSGTSTLSGAFLAGFKDFVTPFRSVNESGRLFARCCKLMIFRTWSSVSWVRGSEDEMEWAFQSICGHYF